MNFDLVKERGAEYTPKKLLPKIKTDLFANNVFCTLPKTLDAIIVNKEKEWSNLLILRDDLEDKFKEICAALDTANKFLSLNLLKSRLLKAGCKNEGEDVENAMKAN
ncbi:hypothetical protein GQX74_014658 [Glossina fuscipes]|nr:hypothetical protein GQX74_014658 [Glossina fuscipes]